MRDTEAVRNSVSSTDMVFHLAALIAFPYSYVNPREVINVNIMGTLNLLMAARDFGVRHVVHTSTSGVYGTAQYVPIDEELPLQGQSLYSASKICVDRIAESFYRSFETPVITLRPFNTFGPRQSVRAVIPTMITQALTFAEVKLGNLEPERDFTFVQDTADGFLKIAKSDSNVLGEDFNLGNDTTIRIDDFVDKIFEIVGKIPKIVTDPQRIRPGKSKVMKLWASNDKARYLIGWEPHIFLEEGLCTTIEWVSAHPDLYQSGQYAV